MQHYRCKCGKATGFGSMSLARCVGCDECGTTLNTHPDLHSTPAPHKFIIAMRLEREGVALWKECADCQKKKELTEDERVEFLAKPIGELDVIDARINLDLP